MRYNGYNLNYSVAWFHLAGGLIEHNRGVCVEMKQSSAIPDNSPTPQTSQWSQLQPIETPKLYLMAVSQIAEAISRGRWNPGDRLPPERELCRMFDISRSSVRQALTALEAVGVIQKKAGVGSFVRQGALEVIAQEIVTELVHEGDPIMVVEARRCIEPGIAQAAARNRKNEDLVPLEATLKLMDRFGTPPIAAPEYVDADINFHYLIALATHNPLIVHLFEQIVDRMHQRVWLTAAFPVVDRRAAQYQAHHHGIFEAIRDQEPARARRIVAAHLENIDANLLSISAITSES
jgi:GntR family transcriptional repressor for pyruvate dehydrogenase complex